MRNISSKIGDIDTSIGRIRDVPNNVESRQEISQEISASLAEQRRALSKVKELLEDTSERIQELPRLIFYLITKKCQ